MAIFYVLYEAIPPNWDKIHFFEVHIVVSIFVLTALESAYTNIPIISLCNTALYIVVPRTIGGPRYLVIGTPQER